MKRLIAVLSLAALSAPAFAQPYEQTQFDRGIYNVEQNASAGSTVSIATIATPTPIAPTGPSPAVPFTSANDSTSSAQMATCCRQSDSIADVRRHRPRAACMGVERVYIASTAPPPVEAARQVPWWKFRRVYPPLSLRCDI